MLKPINDRVVLKMLQTQETTKSGIILTSKDAPQIAEVIAVGEGTSDIKMIIKASQKVMINKYQAVEIKHEGQDYLIIRQDDILAIVE